MTITAHIQTALAAITNGNFAETAADLLATLGYRRQSTALWSGTPRDFIERFRATNPGTQSEKTLLTNTRLLHILFQLTDADIQKTNINLSADASQINTGNARSFLFVAVELSNTTYPRGRYAAFTREINKRWQIPTVVLFKTADGRLTLAFVHRREHKRDPERDVLGHVSLIRKIDPANPHRAHLDILNNLHLPKRLQWMGTHGKPKNFDGLLAAWLDALNTEELNRQFYRDLFLWFERAVEESQFPTGADGPAQKEEHIIRLITRLLFVWFIKEKGLVAKELFIENQVKVLLKNYDRETGDSYYRTVLQNLFFATLNTEICTRRFSKKTRDDHRNFSVYRYRNEMDSPNGLLELFGCTPFINGGLFDCLDSFDAAGAGGIRIDCFTDNVRHRAGHSIPNRLFFDENFGSPGLITLLNRYKFTVEENTPIEQEVALDPELLGKVFENLLAAYNPETKETVRKQTGSYYTPRDVVDYMVDESLVAVLAEKVQPDVGDAHFWQERLRYLLDYADAFEDANELFEDTEKKKIVRAIAEIKVLDPAVGSGAFPMGILHKLTLALRRLDPNNKLWEGLQRELAAQRATFAFNTPEQSERDAELREISATFERYRDSDFGRKLHLIQNGIYGVDILPIATQIAKLRFFISLAIDQEPTDNAADNYGIRPLPNLETRFVAADTLLSLDKPVQLSFQPDIINRLEKQLNENRERHFHATTRQQKLKCRETDENLREELATELERAGFPSDVAEKIALWNPYDQNASADWFDAEYMFGIVHGFDVVIGNPPYVQLQKNEGELRKRYKNVGYETFISTGDVYQLFYEKGCHLFATKSGVLCYITSDSWLNTEYGKSTRRYLADRHTLLRLLLIGEGIFENAIVNTSIIVIRDGKSNVIGKALNLNILPNKHLPPSEDVWRSFDHKSKNVWCILSTTEENIMKKMESIGTPLIEWDISINYGIKTGYNKAFIIDNDTKDELVVKDPKSSEIIKPLLRGGQDIQRYQAQWQGYWLIDVHNGYNNTIALNIDEYPMVKVFLDKFYPELKKRQDKGKTPYNLRNCAYHQDFEKGKLVWLDLTSQGRFCYDSDKMFCINTASIMTGPCLKYLCSVLNSKLIAWFIKKTAPTGMGMHPRWKKNTVEAIPVPNIPFDKQHSLIRLVENIIDTRKLNPNTDISNIEAEIDLKISKLYELTEAEIFAIEN